MERKFLWGRPGSIAIANILTKFLFSFLAVKLLFIAAFIAELYRCSIKVKFPGRHAPKKLSVLCTLCGSSHFCNLCAPFPLANPRSAPGIQAASFNIFLTSSVEDAVSSADWS